MKAKYIILSLIASLAVLVGCEKEGFHFLEGLKVDSSYVSVPLAGGSNTIEVDADGFATFSTPASINGNTQTWTLNHGIGQCWYASIGLKYLFN